MGKLRFSELQKLAKRIKLGEVKEKTGEGLQQELQHLAKWVISGQV